MSSNAAALLATTGGSLPGYSTAAQQQFFAYNPVNGPVVADGVHWRLSPPNFAVFDFLYPPLPPLLVNLPNQFS